VKKPLYVISVFVLGFLFSAGNISAEGGKIKAGKVEAEELVLVSKQGKTYAVLGLNDEDGTAINPEPYLSLMDSSGKERIAIRLSAGDPALTFYDENGEAFVDLRRGPYEGETQLTLSDKSGSVQLGINHFNETLQYPELSFRDKEENLRFRISLGNTGTPIMDFFSKEGNRSGMRLAIENEKFPRLTMLDEAGQSRILMGLADDNSAMIDLRHWKNREEGLTRARLVVSQEDGTPQLNFADETGKIIWTAP